MRCSAAAARVAHNHQVAGSSPATAICTVPLRGDGFERRKREHFATARTSPVPGRSVLPSATPPACAKGGFDTFVDYAIGESNRDAVTAVNDVICAVQRGAGGKVGGRGRALIIGTCGCGKTHLLRAVVQWFDENCPGCGGGKGGALYLASDELGERLRSGAALPAKLKLLILDDIQLMPRSIAMQRSLIAWLDQCQDRCIGVIAAADGSYKTSRRMSAQLKSRFNAGTMAMFTHPSLDERLELTHRLATRSKLRCTEGAARELAGRCIGSVREIESALTTASLAAQLRGVKEIDVEDVFEALKERGSCGATLGGAGERISIDEVIRAVREEMQVSKAMLIGNRRNTPVVMARMLVAALGRELTACSYPEIAQAMGRKHHSTVHTAHTRFRRRQHDPEIQCLVECIRLRISKRKRKGG